MFYFFVRGAVVILETGFLLYKADGVARAWLISSLTFHIQCCSLVMQSNQMSLNSKIMNILLNASALEL